MNMKRRSEDMVQSVEDKVTRVVRKNFTADPKVEGLILQLAQTERKKVLVACGELLLSSEINALVASQKKNSEKELATYRAIKNEICKILFDLLPEITALDFDNVKKEEEDAYIRIIDFLRENKKESILLGIAKKCTNERIAKHALWYFLNKRDAEKLREINKEAVHPTIKNLTDQRLN